MDIPDSAIEQINENTDDIAALGDAHPALDIARRGQQSPTLMRWNC